MKKTSINQSLKGGMNRMFFFLCCLLSLFFIPQVHAVPFQVNQVIKSQKVTLNIKDKTLYETLSEIKNQTGYGFAFQEGITSDDFNKVSLNVVNTDVEIVLNQLFKDTKYSYQIVNNIIKITKKSSTAIIKGHVKGKVVDTKKTTMVGVTAHIVGTAIGGITNNSGEFDIVSPVKDGFIEFSFIGYKRIKLPFVVGQYMNITMEEEQTELDEVHVVAYGTTNRRQMTGAISSVSSKDIKDVPSTSVANLLQGRIAGMDVTNISGAPGAGGTQVTIRGYNSLSVESARRFSNPLWVIDGVPMAASFSSPVTGTNGLADLNPDVIESIQVLKDASATSLYGSRAANGVIIVTTKKGYKNQDATFDVNFSYSLNYLPEYPVETGGKAEREFRLYQNKNYRTAYYDYVTRQYVYPTSYNEAWGNYCVFDRYWGDGSVSGNGNGDMYQDSLNSFYNNSTNFFKYYFDVARTLNANIQTTGGSERMTYSVGIGYYDEDGILKGSDYSRVNLMGNFLLTPRKYLTVDFRNYLSFSDRSRGVSSSGLSSGNMIETIPGNPLTLSSLLPGGGVVTEDALKSLQSIQEKNKTYRLRSSFGLQFDFTQYLNLTNTASIDYSQNNRNYFSPAVLSDKNRSVSDGEIGRDYTILNEALLNYSREFNNKHAVKAFLGFSYQYDEYNYVGGEGQNGPSDYVHYVTEQGWPAYINYGEWIEQLKDFKSDNTVKKMISYFGSLNYGFEQKYLFTATIRRDGSSVFGKNVRWTNFPSFAFAWNFSEEPLFKKMPTLNFGKLRASWGISGNQFHQAYLAYGVLSGGRTTYEGQPTIAPNYSDGYYNPNLTWEETRQYDLGIDMNLFNYRMSMSFDYYNRKTSKMLSKTRIPGSHVSYSQFWHNAAAISNCGVEFEIKYDLFRKDDSFWNISLNLAKNWNRLLSTYNDKDVILGDEKDELHSYVLGKPLGSIFGYSTNGYYQNKEDLQYYYRQNGSYRPLEKRFFSNVFYTVGDIKIDDVNGDCYVSTSDYVYLGSSLPKIYGGIVNQIKWKDFDLNMLWSFSIGRDMIYALPLISFAEQSRPVFCDLEKDSFWQQEGDNSKYPLVAADKFNDMNSYMMDRYVEHVSYLKLKSITIGYNIPNSLTKYIHLKDLRVFVSGENLVKLDNYSGLDPETVDLNTGIDLGDNYPLARKFIFGITLKL